MQIIVHYPQGKTESIPCLNHDDALAKVIPLLDDQIEAEFGFDSIDTATEFGSEQVDVFYRLKEKMSP